MLAIGGAIGMATLLNTLDTSVRSRHDLTALLAVPPLAVLPWIETRADRVAQARAQRISIASVAAATVVAIMLVHFFYKPLDVLMQVALRWATA